jgi:uncharacterized protein YbcV (DUF1398 family)
MLSIQDDVPLQQELILLFSIMFEPNDEETLMTSDDGSIILTSHRVIQKTGEKKNQILIEDLKIRAEENLHW